MLATITRNTLCSFTVAGLVQWMKTLMVPINKYNDTYLPIVS